MPPVKCERVRLMYTMGKQVERGRGIAPVVVLQLQLEVRDGGAGRRAVRQGAADQGLTLLHFPCHT